MKLWASLTIILIILTVIIIVLVRLPTSTITILGIGIIGTLALTAISGLVIFGLLIRERLLLQRAKRKRAERDAEITSIVAGDQVFINDMNHNAYWRSSHLDPRYYANSKDTYSEPSNLEIESWRQFNAPKMIEKQLPASTAQQAQQIPNLFNILTNAERVLVKGPSNAGKTTLFQNIARQVTDNIVVIDPHYAPGIWSDHCQIIGKGHNHQEITEYLNSLSQELSRRYQMRSNGDESFKPLTVIIDEWMSISTKCDNATAVITEMITESRKAKIRLLIGSHSDQVEALGIRGQGKLREGLLIVRLYYDQFTNERSITYDYGKGERPCSLYGEPVITQLNEDEQIVSSMLASGQSRSAIAVRLFGHAGGNQLKEVDKIIERMSS